MAAPTSAEIALIDKFRTELSGILDDQRQAQDDFLLRWIRARNGDLGKAKEMLQNHLKWFSEKNICNIQTVPKPHFFDEYFYQHPNTDGVDREGRPLYLAPVGKWDMKELLRVSNPDEIILAFIRVFEQVKGRLDHPSSRPSGDFMAQFICIGDFHGFGWRTANSWPSIQRLLEMASMVEAHYPEMVRTMYFVNCPRIFMWIVPFFKKVFPEQTVGKLQFYGTNVDEWLPVLEKVIDHKYLEVLHGGVANDKK